MSETHSKNDPTADWPEEVKQAYEHLKIPSLYDAVVANEKLSLEFRRQDRELKAIVEGMQLLSSQVNSVLKILEEEWEEYESDGGGLVNSPPDFENATGQELTDLEIELLQENEVFLEEQSRSMLMDTHDDMRDLSRSARQAIYQILALLPKKEGLIPHLPSWHPVIEGILQSIVESIEKTRYQLLTRLEEMHIEMVDPQPGESVNKALHRIVDRLPGGKPGTIAHVIRLGYQQNQNVLRLADVTVYQET